MSRQVSKVEFKWVGRCCLSIATLGCTSPAKRLPPKTVNKKKFSSYFNQEPIKLKHCPAKILNLFLLILFQHCFLKNADVLPLFLLFSRKMESNIKMKVILKWKFKPIAWLPFIRGILQWQSTLQRFTDSDQI